VKIFSLTKLSPMDCSKKVYKSFLDGGYFVECFYMVPTNCKFRLLHLYTWLSLVGKCAIFFLGQGSQFVLHVILIMEIYCVFFCNMKLTQSPSIMWQKETQGSMKQFIRNFNKGRYFFHNLCWGWCPLYGCDISRMWCGEFEHETLVYG
jgi:hypothetical protein